MSIMTPRGLRNNNPCNIRLSRTTYEGEVKPSQDSAFKQFQTIAYGYRAAFVLLDYYYSRLGLKTLRQMLGRWAPPIENDTGAYVRHVSSAAGCSPDVEIDISDRNLMVKIVSEMSRVENGRQAVASEVNDGWNLYRAGRA